MLLDRDSEDDSYLHSLEESLAVDHFYKLISEHLIALIEGARGLTDREFLVLREYTDGKSFNDIGLQLKISKQTVQKSYKKAINKLKMG